MKPNSFTGTNYRDFGYISNYSINDYTLYYGACVRDTKGKKSENIYFVSEYLDDIVEGSEYRKLSWAEFVDTVDEAKDIFSRRKKSLKKEFLRQRQN